MFFFKKASKKVTTETSLPSNWPSSLHHKCSSSRCYHPNPPQAVSGLYNCSGITRHGSICEGIYIVSQASANQSMRDFHDRIAREEAKERAKETLQRRTAQRRRPDGNRAASSRTPSSHRQAIPDQANHAQRYRQPPVQQLPVEVRPHQARYATGLPSHPAQHKSQARTYQSPVHAAGPPGYEDYLRRF